MLFVVDSSFCYSGPTLTDRSTPVSVLCIPIKVLLGEVNAGLSTTQVVVKELKASASVQDQMQFLEEAQPYRSVRCKIYTKLRFSA